MIVLGLGSNMGDREKNIISSIDLLTARYDIQAKTVSSLYETAPVGFTTQPNFLNAVIHIATGLAPKQLLEASLAVEKFLGRVRTQRWGPRVIDIDILLYHDISMADEYLTIPHPRLAERAFVLVPLAEIAGNLPLYNGLTPNQLLKKCPVHDVCFYKKLTIQGGKIFASL